jgi:hypothetical protein
MHFKFAVVAVKNYGRKIPSSSFIYVVLVVGQLRLVVGD